MMAPVVQKSTYLSWNRQPVKTTLLLAALRESAPQMWFCEGNGAVEMCERGERGKGEQSEDRTVQRRVAAGQSPALIRPLALRESFP